MAKRTRQVAALEIPLHNSALAPRLVAWEATRACNLACVHCRAEAQPFAHPDQLTTDEARRLVGQIAEFAQPIFIITGGNPLMRTDIFEIARYASDSGLRVVMSPSGTNVSPEIVREMLSAGVKRISVSIDGPNAAVHDSFRRVGGAFDAVIASLAHVREGGLPFQVNTTVTRHNIAMLPQMMDLVASLGAVTWDVFMLVPTGRGKVEMEISPEEYEGALSFVYEAQRRSPILVKMTCAPHFRRIERQRSVAERLGGDAAAQRPAVGHPAAVANQHGAPPAGHGHLGSHLPAQGDHLHGVAAGTTGSPAHGAHTSRGCMAGNGFCFVSHVGEVFGCGYLPLLAGNVRTQHFREIYQGSALFNTLRDYHLLHDKCGVCEYRAACGGCRARALGTSGDYLGAEPYCTYEPINARV